MKIIVLTDASNRGKTTSIKLLATYFTRQEGFSTKVHISMPSNDENVVIETSNGSNIALCSGGDDRLTVEGNINFALSHNCDILVSAARSKGDGYNKITDFILQKGNSGLLVKAIDFWAENNCLADNENKNLAISSLTAEHLKRIVEYALTR